MHLSPNMKMFRDTKKSPEVVLPYSIQGDLQSLLSTEASGTEQAKILLQAARSLGEGKGQGTCVCPRLGHSLSFLGVQVAEGDGVERVVSSEEQSEIQGRECQGQQAPTSAPPQTSPISRDTPIGSARMFQESRTKPSPAYDQVHATQGHPSSTHSLDHSPIGSGDPGPWPWGLLLPLVVS